MKAKKATNDRAARWCIFRRYDHKDGGYFWSHVAFHEGETAPDALKDVVPGAPACMYAVVDWSTAAIFENAPVLFPVNDEL